MPYILYGVEDGKPPAGFAPTREKNPPLGEGEAVVEEFERGWVWDQASQKLKPPGPADEALDRKDKKNVELVNAALERVSSHLPLVSLLDDAPSLHVGDREVLMRLAAASVGLSEAAGVVPDPVLVAIAETANTLLAKLEEVQSIDVTQPDAVSRIESVELFAQRL